MSTVLPATWTKEAAAFTLVELLCCIALIAIVTATAALGLSGTSDRASMIAAEATLCRMDRMCRQMACSRGSLILRTGIDGEELFITTYSHNNPVVSEALPPKITCALQLDDGGHAVQFDRAGRCGDYRVSLRSERSELAWRVSGSTGWRTMELKQ